MTEHHFKYICAICADIIIAIHTNVGNSLLGRELALMFFYYNSLNKIYKSV